MLDAVSSTDLGSMAVRYAMSVQKGPGNGSRCGFATSGML